MDMLAKMINLLQEQGKKQKDLTDYLGLSKNTFTGWKRGDNASYLKYAKQIADYLGCLLYTSSQFFSLCLRTTLL